MIRQYWEHRHTLERLVSMAQSDRRAETITPDGAIVSGKLLLKSEGESDRIQAVIPADRWAQYMRLFKETGSTGGIFKGENGAIDFEIDRPSLINGDSRKGIEFTTTPPSPIVPSLDGLTFDDVHKLAPKTNTAYRQIAREWYLWLFFSE